MHKISGCFITGVHHVLSTVVGNEFSLQEICREFVRRYRQREVDKQALPMLAAECPGCNWSIAWLQ